MTSWVSDQNVPSDISAMAVIFCVSARRTRVAIVALPDRAPSRTLITFGCGFFSLKTWIALTYFSFGGGEATETVIGTVLPFSTNGGKSSITRPLRIVGVPMALRIAVSICPVAASADPDIVAPTAASPPASSTSRRVIFIMLISSL
jgi:hypothetical protein